MWAWLRHWLELEERQMWRGLLLLVLATSLGSALIEGATSATVGRTLLQWVGAWLLDFSTDLAVGMVVIWFVRAALQALPQPTIVAPEVAAPVETYFIDAKEVPPFLDPHTARQQLLDQLVLELRSASTPEARQLVLRRLKSEGLSLAGQSLIEIDLSGADLQGVTLEGANLTKAKLRTANLQAANLRGAILQQAQLIEADLQGADLSQANLERCFLSGANLSRARLRGVRLNASLWRVNLQGADLSEADLSQAELFRTNLAGARLHGVKLADTKINTDTILPDGSQWSQRIDIARFTDPQHPAAWQP